MIIACPSCSTRYQHVHALAERVAEQAQCSRCDGVFVLGPPRRSYLLRPETARDEVRTPPGIVVETVHVAPTQPSVRPVPVAAETIQVATPIEIPPPAPVEPIQWAAGPRVVEPPAVEPVQWAARPSPVEPVAATPERGTEPEVQEHESTAVAPIPASRWPRIAAAAGGGALAGWLAAHLAGFGSSAAAVLGLGAALLAGVTVARWKRSDPKI